MHNEREEVVNSCSSEKGLQAMGQVRDLVASNCVEDHVIVLVV